MKKTTWGNSWRLEGQAILSGEGLENKIWEMCSVVGRTGPPTSYWAGPVNGTLEGERTLQM